MYSCFRIRHRGRVHATDQETYTIAIDFAQAIQSFNDQENTDNHFVPEIMSVDKLGNAVEPHHLDVDLT